MTATAMLATVTRRADRLMRHARIGDAMRLLAQALTGFDPVTAPPQPWLLRAAITYVDALACEPDTATRHDAQLTWARCAYRLAADVGDTGDTLWNTALVYYISVLMEQDLAIDAVQVCRLRPILHKTKEFPTQCP